MNLMSNRRLLSSGATFLASFLIASSTALASVEIAQQPLLVAQPVPGNMAIIGSFEFPTMVTRAYRGNFVAADTYVGYFDSAKCYTYIYDTNELNRHFSPSRFGTNCNQAGEWSGKYLNWASMQSIDIFRHILTGGYRHRDDVSETWLEKGVQTSQGNSSSNFPDAEITTSLQSHTPAPTSWTAVKARIGDGTRMGNIMRFTGGDLTGATRVAYNPAVHNSGTNFSANTVYEVSVRVKVCVSGLLEANCKAYGSNYKPEGLIQANSTNMRYSAFGYLNDNSSPNPNRDGGILHARMKYVGPIRVNDQNRPASNPNAEWRADTGQFVRNPDPTDAAATTARYPGLSTIQHSGVISYINNSGMIVPGTLFKRYDNVSELFYAAYRYMRGLPNRSEYIAITQTGDALNRLVGGLPVIDWTSSQEDDPIQFSCQKNFFLGIGDTNTHPDTRVPKSDDSSDIAARVTRISAIEGGLSFTGGRSALIAGLAFDANVRDLRPDMPGRQTASTYWIDILEGGDLKGRTANQYWLAAKYGGLKAPETFNPASDPIQDSWWHTTGEMLNASGYKRPDNFYVVANAQDMVNGLVRAFADIQKEQTGNRSSLALNSTKLEAGSATFQAQYTSGSWTGDLNAFSINSTTGQLGTTPVWRASSKLPLPASRIIKTWNGTAFVNFTAAELSNVTLANALRDGSSYTLDQIMSYLRGVRTLENNATGLRVRQNPLGDIVNSQPVFVGKPNASLFRGRTFPGAASYASWAQGITRTPVVYVGANDGMLHGFNATVGQTSSGVETFAYVPRAVIQNGMGELASPSYVHRYFVDGELAVADAYDGTNWRTVLVGTLGAGGVNKARNGTNNAIFALDVTDPAAVKFLWEKSSADIPALGNNLGKPVIAQLTNGQWSVVLGNGPNGINGNAALVRVNLFSGEVTTNVLSTEVGNGLAAVRAWDSEGDGITDAIYAGDLLGSLWKVTGFGNATPTVTRLFRAVDPSGNAQPITSAPLAGRSPYSREVWLFFGTGRYLNNGDLANTQIQSWYGINDNGSTNTIGKSADLLERKILADVAVSNEVTARVIEAGAREDLLGKRGWYIDLYRVGSNGARSAAGERMITSNQFQGSALIGNTRIPDASDPCAPTGRGVVMAIEPFTGARLFDTYFDLNRDRSFTVLDKVVIDGVETVVSGIGLGTGFSNPSFLDQKMYIPTDDGEIRDLDVNPFSIGSGRTSWRELINVGN